MSRAEELQACVRALDAMAATVLQLFPEQADDSPEEQRVSQCLLAVRTASAALGSVLA